MVQLSQHCPGLRHLTANRSKTLSDVALGALAGTHRVSAGFVRGCKKLRRQTLKYYDDDKELRANRYVRVCYRLEISGCYLITASKIVSLLLFLPQIQYLHCPERMEQVIANCHLNLNCPITHIPNCLLIGFRKLCSLRVRPPLLSYEPGASGQPLGTRPREDQPPSGHQRAVSDPGERDLPRHKDGQADGAERRHSGGQRSRGAIIW